MGLMKIVVPLCLFFMTTCSAIENATTKSDQQLNVQKREKGYLIEDDPNEGPEQKRDERQSTPAINNRNLDPKGNSRIINVRLLPPPNNLAAPKPGINPGPQRIPTKIPVMLKAPKVLPSPAQAMRLKMLENKINETLCNANKQNNMYPNNAPLTMSPDGIPYFRIEDKIGSRRSESPNDNKNDEKPDLGSNDTLIISKEISRNEGNNLLNRDGHDLLNGGKDDQLASNSETKSTVHKPVNFFVDEPEPLPPSFRKQQQHENTCPQSKENSPKKMKEIPIGKTGNKKPKKVETRKNDDDNDPDVVKISNGTHLITIRKIPENERYNTERMALRIGEEDIVPTEGRIINQPPPEPKLEKPAYDEPEKHSFSITEKINTCKDPNFGFMGLPYRDNKNTEVKGQNNCITKQDYQAIDCSQISPPITLQPNPPMTYNDVNQESWNYLQNPYYLAYYQNIYDQCRRNYGAAQTIPNLYGQECTNAPATPSINPCIYHPATTDPHVPEIQTYHTPYYPNVSPTMNADPTQNLYKPYVYESQPEIDDIAWPHRPDNVLYRIRVPSKDVDIKTRNPQINDPEAALDIDIRREIEQSFDGTKVENGIGRVTNPYAVSSQPININGALVYPYLNPNYRYMR